jgi:hypothetical protein
MQPSVDLLQVPTPGPCSLTSLVPTPDATHRLAAARGPPLPNLCTRKNGRGRTWVAQHKHKKRPVSTHRDAVASVLAAVLERLPRRYAYLPKCCGSFATLGFHFLPQSGS